MKKLILFQIILFFSLAGFCQQQPDIKFSHERGFYFKKFRLKISSKIQNTEIKYTTGGFDLFSDSVKVFKRPLHIDSTTVIKAGLFINDSLISDISIHTFIFPEKVLTQPAEIKNYPNTFYPLNSFKTQFEFADFEMDREITQHPDYKDSIIPGLLSIPSVSVILPFTDFLIFYNSEETVKTSIEIIYPNKKFKNEQVFCGIKGHSHLSMKRSMRVLFKKEFGPTKFESNILKTSVLNSRNATTKFDHLVFRAGNNRSWTREPDQGESAFTRDQWFRDSQLLLSGDGSHGTFAHLYINGIYMGLYNVIERPDENFLEDYYGGEKNNWISLSHANKGEEKKQINEQITKQLSAINSKEFNSKRIYKYVDLENFCDFMILRWYAATNDYLYNNWWLGTYLNNSGKLKYFIWDSELTFENDMSPGRTVPNEFRIDYNGQSILLKIWDTMKKDEDFMLLFADRVYKHCFNGWLSPEKASRNWRLLNNNIRLAIIAESARWGDALVETPKTRDDEWLQEVNRIDSILKIRNIEFVNILIGFGFYPTIDPPEITIQNKTEKEISIKIKNTNGKGNIVYTIDGKDPRLEGGNLYSEAKQINSDSININTDKGLIIKARIKNNGNWSPLNEYPVLFENGINNFKVTEIMFLPDSTKNIEENNFEFIEFRNTGNEPIDISGVKIEDGIEFTVPEPTLLNPGQFYILAENATWFYNRYGFEPDGVYRGKLNNISERITIYSKEGKKLMDINYASSGKNNQTSVNQGFSIIPKPLNIRNYSNTNYWTLSPTKGGTPGAANN